MITERGEISEEDIKVGEAHILGISGGHWKEDWMEIYICVCIYMFIYVKYMCIYPSNPLSNIYLTYINICLTHIIYI